MDPSGHALKYGATLFNKAKRKRDEAFEASGKAINEKVRLYARIGQVLLAARRDRVIANRPKSLSDARASSRSVFWLAASSV